MAIFAGLFWILFFQAAPANGLFSAFNESSAWDDFVNNIATDLAPIIALFGEQPTKQFLSESTTHLDSIIFAMAPIGVITTIVSVIRLYGTPSLRSLIGRAREPRALAESELCSSTSDDVCELWSNGGICRVYGRPKLLEFIFDKDANSDEFYSKFESGDGPRGIYATVATSNRDKNWRKTDPNELLFGCWLHHKRKTEDKQSRFAPHPNLAINIGIREVDRRLIWIVAVFGISLQASVLGYGLWANWHRPFYNDAGQPSLEFVILTLIGTTFLCLGIGLSARLIDGKSEEQTFVTDGHPLRFCWLQAGGQRIGDQVFDAFAYTEEMKEYVTSWRVEEDELTSVNSRRLAFLAVTLSLTGWTAQFIGLRGQHGTVALFQLLGTLAMSIARGILRGNRMDPLKNLLGGNLKGIQDHELDWQALNLPIVSDHNGGNGPDYFWLLVDSSDKSLWPNTERTPGCKRSLEGHGRFVGGLCNDNGDFSALESTIANYSRVLESLKNTTRDQDPGVPNAQETSNLEDISIGAKLMHIRLRLAHLTSDSELLSLPSWQTNIRDVAARLRDTLEKAAAYMFTPPHSGPKWPWDMEYNALIWTATCQVHESKIFGKKSRNFISFSMSKYKDRWEIDQNQLEAILGLWSWTVERLSQNIHSKGNKSLASQLGFKRLIVRQLEYDEFLSMLRSWVTHNYTEHLQPLKSGQKSILSIPATLSMFCDGYPASLGFRTITHNADSPLLYLMAQDIFTLFLREASALLSYRYAQYPEGNQATYLSQGFFQNSHVESLVSIMTSTKLATREEALMSVVPALSETHFLPSHHSLFFTLLSRAHSLRVQNQFRESEGVLVQLDSLKVSGLEMMIQRAIESGTPNLHSRAGNFEDFGLSPYGFEISNRQPLSQFPYDMKPDWDYGHILALTFPYRFDISESTVQDRKQVLRWAIEFGYSELVDCLWKLEKVLHLKESAFSGGPDEAFWTINGSYDSFIKIDILHFLITVTEPNLTYDTGKFHMFSKEKKSEEEGSSDEAQILEAFCKAHPGWKGSHNIESLKRMHKAYRDYGNILTAAVSIPNSAHIVKLLVEHGGLRRMVFL
ncbi:hypothetical protein TrVFT333_005912 [Trichoderma virens FT-333]|nr:hypothetical protein TrVFT333_005912 [Trichoderma virens FT-333]